MKPLRQSTLNHGRYVPVHLCAWICSAFSRNVQLKCVLLPWRSSKLNSSKTAYSHVASWADKYLDSGVSLTMDTAESAGSDYDSDDSRSSQETVHHSYSYVPSDFEVRAHVGFKDNRFIAIVKPCWLVVSQVLEIKSEAVQSVTPSRTSSIASSLRRRLSAFSTKVPSIYFILINQNFSFTGTKL